MEKNSVYFISSKLKIMVETRINCHSKYAIIKNDQYEYHNIMIHINFKKCQTKTQCKTDLSKDIIL